MTNTRYRGATAAISLTVGLTLGLTGCAGHAPGDLGRLQKLLEACPDRPIYSYVSTDGSGTSASTEIRTDRLKSIRSVIERTAVCSGHLTVTAFGTNSVTAPIYDAEVQIPGATDNARLRQVPEFVAETFGEIDARYDDAIASLPAGGTDVTGLFRLLEEAQALQPELRLEGTVLTDGLTNQGIVIDQVLSTEEAEALADSVSVPDLAGSTVTIIGIGRVAGDPLPSDFISGLKAFYTRLGHNTGADSVLVVTDGR